VQQTRGGHLSHGGNPADAAERQRAGTAEPVTLVDLDGGVTRIAPFSEWTREQVRHPGEQLLFVTRLERGQLWHRAKHSGRTWGHEVQVGPATVVSEAGQFHAVAEPDGGATITCLEGQVAVATQLTAPLLLDPDEAVSIAADGETCIVIEPSAKHAIELQVVDRSARRPDERTAGLPAPFGRWFALGSRQYVVPALLALVAVLLVVLIALMIFYRGTGHGASIGAVVRSHRLAAHLPSSDGSLVSAGVNGHP